MVRSYDKLISNIRSLTDIYSGEEEIFMPRNLLELAGLLERIDTNLRLHAFVYLAQEFQCWKEERYDFDFALNMPFSPELEDDFIRLQSEQAVVYVDGEYIINSTVPPSSLIPHLNVLREIAACDTWQLVDLARLVYLLKTGPSSGPSIEERAGKLFFMGKEKVSGLREKMKDFPLSFATV